MELGRKLRLTLPLDDAHQDVNHDHGATASNAGAVRTDLDACGDSQDEAVALSWVGPAMPVWPCPASGRTCAARPRPPLPGCTCSDRRGPAGPWRGSLGPVHLFQEAEDSSGPRGDPVVGPAEVLVMLASLCVAETPGQGQLVSAHLGLSGQFPGEAGHRVRAGAAVAPGWERCRG